MAQRSHLSLQVAPDEFAFAVFLPEENRYLGLEYHHFPKQASVAGLVRTLEGILRQAAVLQHEFRSVSGSWHHPQHTLVPESLFDRSAPDTLLYFNYDAPEGAAVRHDALPNHGSFNVYPLPDEVHHLLHQRFPQVQLRHHTTHWLESLLITNKTRTGWSAWLDLHHDRFELAFLEGPHVRFYNAFEYRTDEDVAYYVLYAGEQWQLSLADLPLAISGQVEPHSGLPELLGRYLPHTQLHGRPEHFQYSPVFGQVPGHFFVSLLNQYLCA